jgi:ubiquinone/menaquinone biosynthesis C-methylase UbiE
MEKRYKDKKLLARIAPHTQVSDLGESMGIEFQGIFSPRYSKSIIGRYISEQFISGSRTYAERYQQIEVWDYYLRQAFHRLGFSNDEKKDLLILDIGSGAGNTIFPLLNLCPGAHVLASDLSVHLLAMLKRTLEKRGLAGRCTILQLNAEDLDFAPETFDAVVGGAILHHLFAPEKTVEGCSKILKRGGCAIFFEPFENGNAIIGCMYRDILRSRRKRSIPPETRKLLTNMIRDFEVRKGRDKSSHIFARRDDKWLFTKSYFLELAARYRFHQCDIHALHKTKNQFINQTEVNLRLGIGESREALPKWAWRIVRKYEGVFSEDLKKEFIIEGCIILKK